MITWRKIGVVISVLWLIGPPIYVLVDTNQPASKTLGSCMTVVKNFDWCLPDARFVSPREMAHNLIPLSHRHRGRDDSRWSRWSNRVGWSARATMQIGSASIGNA